MSEQRQQSPPPPTEGFYSPLVQALQALERDWEHRQWALGSPDRLERLLDVLMAEHDMAWLIGEA